VGFEGAVRLGVVGFDGLGLGRLAFDRVAFFCSGLGGLAFGGFDFDRSGFDGAAPGLRARIFKAAIAALAFFLACLATFLLAFANFRARLSTSLAARSACFTASACAVAFFASALNRCAAAACFADVADDGDEGEVATM
jgi:hypothetical protein